MPLGVAVQEGQARSDGDGRQLAEVASENDGDTTKGLARTSAITTGQAPLP